MIEATALSFSYPNGRKVIDDISFRIEKGESIALLGANGSGKSTLLKLISALTAVSEGKLSVAGISSDSERNRRKIRSHIAYVFQNPDSCFVEDTVLEDAMFTPLCFGMDELAARKTAMKSLEDFGVSAVAERSIRSLSGGEKERCILASISSIPQDIYVFDEVLTFLDEKARSVMLDAIDELGKKGKTIIFVTHDTEEALHFDKTMLMKDGRILDYGKTSEVLCNMDQLEEAGVRRTKAMDIYLLLKERGLELPVIPLGKEELCSLLKR